MADAHVGDLVLSSITKQFDTFKAVDDISLTFPRGSFFALLGPSGCGKTTTLRMIAGLEAPTSGTICIGEDDITALKAYQRPVNTVFQSYALFPHLNILDNVAFGLKQRKDPQAKAKATEALAMVELSHTANKKPTQLSGGMQQRVALARALVNRPDVLLLDEPLGALDLKLRRQMQIELKRIQSEVGLTFVHVTHDQEEAMTMADTIAVMNKGKIEQLADPATLYEKPATTFVANFLGQSNLLDATITGTGSKGTMTARSHDLDLAVAADSVPEGITDVWVGVRPEKLRLGDSGVNQLRGEVKDVSFTGVATTYLVATPWGTTVSVVQQNDGSARATLGEVVTLSWDPGQEFVLDQRQAADAGSEDLDG